MGNKVITICSIPYEIVHMPDAFNGDAVHFGEIDYKAGKITLSEGMSPEQEHVTLIHEIIHGALVQSGYGDYSQDERFVQALANAFSPIFKIAYEADAES